MEDSANVGPPEPLPEDVTEAPLPPRKKKPKKRHSSKDLTGKDEVRKKPRKVNRKPPSEYNAHISASQQSVNEQMRRVLEEDQYSALGSIVPSDKEDDDDNNEFLYRGQIVRVDRAALQQTIRKKFAMDRRKKLGVVEPDEDDEEEEMEESDADVTETESKKDDVAKKPKPVPTKKVPRKDDVRAVTDKHTDTLGLDADDDFDRDGGSIFGQTTGSSNSTWVECDKCKKWRRLRGVIDEKKLPTKWYCYMNKNDPDRARCSAPEEEYETSHTPESAADARTRKHLRVWVRRLQCNEAYEARQGTITRGKKRAAASSSKEPYEWVRCCNPSCGKWRALLRIMDAKSSVIDRTTNGEWYCVMNTWDEKAASCAAPQENLPAVGCPPWVMQDDD